MSETSQPPIVGRLIIGLATGFWILTSPWTLQAFVPESYFLRLPDQLRAMSTPNGFGQIERSLAPFFVAVGIETAVLLVVAALGWRFRSTAVATSYLLVVLMMAVITLWRLSDAFSGLM